MGGSGVIDNGGGSSAYQTGRFVGKIYAWIFAAIAGLWGVNKARGG